MNYLFILSENVVPVLIGSSYFYFGGKHWSSPFVISLILPVLGFILVLFIPRSPVYLVEKGKIEEAEKELRSIASFNGKSLPYEIDIIRPEQENVAEDQLLIKKRKLFTTLGNFVRLVLTIIISIHSNANLVMWGFYVKNLELNVFLLNIIDCFTSTLVIISTYYALKSINLKLLIITIMMISLCCVIPIAIESDTILVWIGYLGISSCLKSLAAASVLILNNIFEPALVPTVLTVSNIFTNIAMIAEPIISGLPFPTSIFAFIASSGI